MIRWLRVRAAAALASVVFVALFLAPLVAMAQDGEGLPTSGVPLAIFVCGIVLGVAVTVLTRVAPLTRNKWDDQALAFLKEAEPTLRKWLDPQDPSVPPSPANPSGQG